MVDVFAVADMLVSKVATCYPDDVDLVAYYGSYAKGTAASGSDLDIFYVPVERRNPPVGRTVLIEGILFDFWPIPWTTLEGFATGRLRGWSMAPALVYHAKVIYKRSEEAKVRLDALKQTITDLQKPAARPHMVRRSLDTFPAVLAHLGNLRLAVAGDRLADVRSAGFEVLLAAWECLALANQAFLDQGFRSLTQQACRLHSKPTDFRESVITIGISSELDEIAAAAERLALETRKILVQLQQSMPAEREVCEGFRGAYPEIKDGLRKVLSACSQQRPFDASIAAWHQQVSLGEMLNDLRNEIGGHSAFNLYSEVSAFYEELGLPDLMECVSDDLSKLTEQTERLDERLIRWLRDHSVSLQTFESIEDFAQTL
jgi:predicted nucleotidyltransferase